MTWGTNRYTVPPRGERDVLVEIRYRDEFDAQNNKTGTVVGEFQHRDGRIWSARIIELAPDNSRRVFRQAAVMLTLASAGCRQYSFICCRLQNAKGVAMRFSNMPMYVYDRLVADAQGTAEHPRSGDIAIFRLHVVRRQQPSLRRQQSSCGFDLTEEPINGIGRYADGQLVIFPTTDEIEDILDQCCNEYSRVMMPSGINQIPDQALLERLEDTAYDDLDSRIIDIDRISDLVDHHFHDSAYEALAGLRDGSYRIREERVIDFHDDDETE